MNSGVARVGDTVRLPVGAWTPAVPCTLSIDVRAFSVNFGTHILSCSYARALCNKYSAGHWRSGCRHRVALRVGNAM
ncbi:hypothetical protein ABT297_36060 [Dactylosporangium sp. NPDC000555]|uniref:hypothetical protein n=1 Tax=Dactylosporangium sp. NPDC000555 TaxID=3154260 RepID=UPI00331AD823